MQSYKKEFIRFMAESGVLLFGDFTLKSGRRAPYFINTGKYRTGAQIARLGEYYAACYEEHGVEADVLVGPAYKGIPLAVSASIALARRGNDLGYCFDRKETKDHGEGGMFVGHPLKDGVRVCIIEDVMTSGKALGEILPKLAAEADIRVSAMLISVDREERGTGETSAAEEAFLRYGIPVYSVVTMGEIVEALEEGIIAGAEYLPAMRAYRAQYGAKKA